MATTLRVEIDADAIATITLDAPGAPVNTMSRAWRADWDEAVERVASQRERIRGVVLASAKPGFCVGADLAEVVAADDAAAVFREAEALKRGFRRLETLGRPVVALLAGDALGGGWELALAAHARFALDAAATRFGTPQVALGLIPGATGVVKTVRRLGLAAAQPYLVEGRLFGPREALALGLVDGLVARTGDLRDAALAWIDAHPDATQPWDRKGHRIPGGTPADPALAAALAVAPAALASRTRGLYPAPQAILEAMVEGALVDYDTATRIESRKLAKVVVGPTAKHLIGAFFVDPDAIAAGRHGPAGEVLWQPTRVGIVGAGPRGAAIACAFAARDIACVLHDPQPARLQAGIAEVDARAGRDVAAQCIDVAEAAARRARVTAAADVAGLRGCDLIVEAVGDDSASASAAAAADAGGAARVDPVDAAAAAIRAAEPMLGGDGLLVATSPMLPLATLAGVCARPQRVVAMRLSPEQHGLRLAEIVRGAETDADAVARACDVARRLGRIPIVVVDGVRGSFTRRVFLSFATEGAAMLAEGIAAPLIEHAALAAGMPHGPLEALDADSLGRAADAFRRACAAAEAAGSPIELDPGERLVVRIVDEWGRPGGPDRPGFYDPAREGRPRALWAGLERRLGAPAAAASPAELMRRLLYRQAIEVVRCLAEGVVATPAEANLGSILGAGFPAWTGGAVRFVASEGRGCFIVRAGELAERHGARFALSDAMRAVVDAARV